jgi:hypothetical protein
MSILNGTPQIIDGWLGLERNGYKTRTACNLLSRTFPKGLCGSELLMRLYARIERNWRDRVYVGAPTDENWRWEKQSVCNPNAGDEVRLERCIIRAVDDHWANQIPVSSGLTSRYGGRRAIDLARLHSNESSYELIELKYESDNPLFAAMEIILYGVLHVFFRVWLLEDCRRNQLLKASSIGLRVLAPETYYRHTRNGLYKFKDLEQILSIGVRDFADAFVPKLKMDFRFDQFPDDLWSGECSEEQLRRLGHFSEEIKEVYNDSK